jgi:hypothetical protein
LPSRDEQLQEAINELIRLGWAEVVGIKNDGQWLYQITKKGYEMVELRHALDDSFDRIISELNKEQGEEQ